MGQSIQKMDQVKFVEDSLSKISLGPFLNTFSHMFGKILMRCWEDLQKQPPKCSVRKGVLRNFAKFTGKRARVFGTVVFL